ncbi:murein hydrolase activator EnvC family protein [Algihabitans albus]|uniref:murein hydrolase activator EnvC family protein n=1 Tax=Algihabitans albus TaxID=2164067 RepID=UPI000E5C7828|nr:peptidoglycan DD-metalloendopeptidase family protein [Algihabitans albus]
MLQVLLSLLLGSSLFAASALAQETAREAVPQVERLEELQREIEAGEAAESAAQARAASLQEEVERLRRDSIAAAARAQELERQLSVAEIAVAFRRAAELRQRARLAERNVQLTVTLAALQRMALQPSEMLLASPGGALETARTALLLSATVPELERRASEVRRDLDRLAALTEATSGERDALAFTRDALTVERASIEDLAGQKLVLQQEALTAGTEAALRVQRLAEEVEDLQELVERLAAEAQERRGRETEAAMAALVRAEELRRSRRSAPDVQSVESDAEPAAEPPAEIDLARETGPDEASLPPPLVASLPQSPLVRPGSVRPFPDVQSSLRLPVAGHVAVNFGEELAGGIDARARGIYMESRPRAQVVAPFDGQVAFAGPFRRYGLLLIIEHDGRYHSLLSGLERIDAVVGQWVLAGEPIGMMGGQDGSVGASRLYYELRRDSQPINPLPWLAMDEERARG